MKRDTLLRLADEVVLRLTDGAMTVEGRDDAVQCDLAMLNTLGRLHRPATFEAALAAVDPPSRDAWMRASAQLFDLIGAGAVEPENDATRPRTDHGFSCLEPHLAMLADQRRTQAYVEAIRRVVRPGDVVLDLGTGSGVLAVAAAQAGARQIYAIERTGIASMAERVFRQNGVGDRIRLIRDVSTRVVLPERADVMVSEIIGTDPLCERILEYTRDAVDRLLVPEPRMVPARLRVSVRAVTLPEAVIEQHVATPRQLARWRDAYGIEFSPLNEGARRAWFSTTNAEAASWPALSPTVALLDIDLTRPPHAPFLAKAQTQATARGMLNGALIAWEVVLDARCTLSNDPRVIDPDCCWGTAAWLAEAPSSVAPGDPIDVSFRYAAPRSTASIVARPLVGLVKSVGA